MDAASITKALTSFIEQKHLDYRRLVGQGYDGAATFSGCMNGVQRRIRAHSAHAVCIHCSCHRLQLASIQAAESVNAIKKMFGTMTNLWKLFYYSPKKAQALKDVQSVLSLPDLKVVKPNSTRRLSHERCLHAIRKDLPAIIITLQQLYQISGDAEAYGILLVLSSFSGVASIILLSQVLDFLARLSCYMQRETADFSRLPVVLESILKELEQLKEDEAEWCSEVITLVDKLENIHEITVTSGHLARNCVGGASAQTLTSYRANVALPYINLLLHNIHDQFSGEAVYLLVSSSIFNPAAFPTEERVLPDYGKKEVAALAEFYGTEATVDVGGVTFSSPPLIDKDEILVEWRLFKRVFLQEAKLVMEEKKTTKPTLQEVKVYMEASGAYSRIFPEIFKLLNILLVLPVGTATVERSFSRMKQIKTRLRNRLNDANLSHLMRIAIEGPELSSINFDKVLEVFKEKNR